MSFDDLLDQPIVPWMSGNGAEADIALSSRIRLARNLCGIPFPNRAADEQLAEVADQLRGTVDHLKASDHHQYMFIEMEKLAPLDRNVLVEKHIVSPHYVEHAEHRVLIVRDDAAVSIMVNEEDHLRIQCMKSGLNLDDALSLANQVDNAVEEKQDIAFNEQMGYLTACPTNLGTGLRASVMVHLPALVITRQLNRILNAFTQLGLAIRGLYGEGTEASGNIFQISNQLTLGYTEQGIIENLKSVAQQVVAHERTARNFLLRQSKSALADRVWRAYGALSFARSMSGQEALSLISEVRLGIDLKIIDEDPACLFNELLVTTRPNYLQKLADKRGVKEDDRDQLRAQVIRDTMKRVKEGR
ncbi:Protein-arginine kinase [bioreactor metagenome]|uniref:Protein-arginine kinase n=1 Tax=bioreactor metagenome TaxID=1076179 RepID=A0A644TPR0_9ZZZZ